MQRKEPSPCCKGGMPMPRQARTQSITNIYHIILRGINRQTIFEDDEDRRYFLWAMKKAKEDSGFKLYAFCLMSNHIHLLMEPAEEPLAQIFKRIGSRYVIWYNRKYQRAGHLFQDRFRSENVDSERYFMTVLRYILQNPMKAGVERSLGQYPWSSYRAYEKGIGSITDTQFAADIFGGLNSVVDFVRQECNETVMDEADFDWRLRDDQAKEIMRKVTQCASPAEFQLLSPDDQKKYYQKLYMEKLSMGQIARLTGVAKSTVSRSIKKTNLQAAMTEPGFTLNEAAVCMFNLNNEEIW